MGKTVARVISVVALVASFVVLGSSFLSVSFATILRGVAAVSATIGFAPEFDFGDGGRQLAENLHSTALAAPAMRVDDPPWL